MAKKKKGLLQQRGLTLDQFAEHCVDAVITKYRAGRARTEGRNQSDQITDSHNRLIRRGKGKQ